MDSWIDWTRLWLAMAAVLMTIACGCGMSIRDSRSPAFGNDAHPVARAAHACCATSSAHGNMPMDHNPDAPTPDNACCAGHRDLLLQNDGGISKAVTDITRAASTPIVLLFNDLLRSNFPSPRPACAPLVPDSLTSGSTLLSLACLFTI
jgi:hypothetical protein